MGSHNSHQISVIIPLIKMRWYWSIAIMSDAIANFLCSLPSMQGRQKKSGPAIIKLIINCSMEEETMFLKSIAISWPGQPLICIAVTETMEDRISIFFSSLSHEYFISRRDIGNGTPFWKPGDNNCYYKSRKIRAICKS